MKKETSSLPAKPPLPRYRNLSELKKALVAGYDPNQLVPSEFKVLADRDRFVNIGGNPAYCEYKLISKTPLQWAISRGALAEVQALLEAKATALHSTIGLWAFARQEQIEIVKLLLTKKATLRPMPMRLAEAGHIDPRPSTPLSALISSYHLYGGGKFNYVYSTSIIKIFLDKADVNERNEDGSTALTCFLERGVSLPFFKAKIHQNRLNSFIAILSAGANVSCADPDKDVIGDAIEACESITKPETRLEVIPYIASIGYRCIEEIIFFTSLLESYLLIPDLIRICWEYFTVGNYFEVATQRLFDFPKDIKPLSAAEQTAATGNAFELKDEDFVAQNKQGLTPLEFAAKAENLENVILITQNLRAITSLFHKQGTQKQTSQPPSPTLN